MPSLQPRDIATSGSTSTVSSPPTPLARDEAEASPDHPMYADAALLEEEVSGSRCSKIVCGRYDISTHTVSTRWYHALTVCC